MLRLSYQALIEGCRDLMQRDWSCEITHHHREGLNPPVQ